MKRPWQDWVLSTSEVIFLGSLMPSIFTANKPDAITSGVTALALCGILAVNASKKWWMSCLWLALTISAWLVLLIQVIA